MSEWLERMNHKLRAAWANFDEKRSGEECAEGSGNVAARQPRPDAAVLRDVARLGFVVTILSGGKDWKKMEREDRVLIAGIIFAACWCFCAACWPVPARHPGGAAPSRLTSAAMSRLRDLQNTRL